jgi:hypothetical protein
MCNAGLGGELRLSGVDAPCMDVSGAGRNVFIKGRTLYS